MKPTMMNHNTPSNRKVLDELRNILASKAFANSPLLSKFLQVVVEKTLSGKGNEIKEYTVGIEVFGKPFNFNPMLDASVRIGAIRLRKQLIDYYKLDGLNSPVRIDLPKGTYRPVFTNSYTADDSYTQQSNFSTSENEERGIQETICVLPFTGFINHESLDFSIDGFCEFLTEKLSLFQDVSVVSFHSVSALIANGGSYLHLEKELGVTCYLTGSIEVERNQILVAVQLNDAKNKIIIWSHSFPAKSGDSSIFEIIDGISDQIVSTLAGYSGVIHYHRFLNDKKAPAISNKMANAIFWFYHYQLNHSKALFHDALRNLEQAVNEDPGCPLSWAILAHLYTDGIAYNYTTVADPLSVADTYVKKSLAINPNCQHAHLAKAWIEILRHNRSKELVVQALNRCIAINPNSTFFLAGASMGFSLAGEYERSLILFDQAFKLNPMPHWWMNFPNIIFSLKQHDFEKMLFHARKIGTPAVIYEHVFEMIALYYLNEQEEVKKLVLIHQQKYLGGLDFVLKALAVMIFDQEVYLKMETALKQIILLVDHKKAASIED